jgi:hypothetical protein
MSLNATSINTTVTGSNYTIDSGDTGWIMLCSTFVFLMVKTIIKKKKYHMWSHTLFFSLKKSRQPLDFFMQD